MRLIDAEKLEDALDWIIDPCVRHDTVDTVREQEEVDAIPVEWLLNHIPNDEVMHRYNEKLIEYLVIGWRKENEERTTLF